MVKWEWCCVFLSPPGPIALLGKQIVTSFGSKGNSKIAGSQLWAWTSDQTKVQHVFSLCPVISANYNPPPPLPFVPPPTFSRSFIILLYPQTFSFSPDISVSFSQTLWSQRQGHRLHSWQAAVCGSFAGAGDYMLLWERRVGGGGGWIRG